MNIQKNVMRILLFSLVFCTVGTTINIELKNDNSAQPKTAAFTGVYDGLAWTYLYNFTGASYDYESIEITSVTNDNVYVKVYHDGFLLGPNTSIGGAAVFDDSTVADYVNNFGTYTAEYGGRSLTVTTNQTGSVIIDTATGIAMEILPYWKLISWEIYSQKSTSDAISGFPLVFILIAIIGTSAILLRRRYNSIT